LNSLNPNTTYFARIYLTNSVGCTNSTIFQFTTNQIVTLLYHFPFDNSLSTSATSPNSGTLSSTGGTNTFVNNGQGNTTGALFVKYDSTDTKKYTANLAQLPVGNTSRSIVMRVNFLTYGPAPFSLRHFVVSWGTGTANQSYGFEKIQTQGQSAVWANNVGIADGTSVATLNNWVTYAITYDSNTREAKYYINGGLRTPANLTHTALNTVGTNIVLGSSLATSFGESNFNIDDLKIYSGALSDSQIQALHNSLSNADFNTKNLKFSLYPNPATNLLNIDIASDIQSVEIYSLQGQKVLTGSEKQINISGLSSGMYMVRVQDVDGGVATQKLVKE
jgi:Secretion system C-terminal sorting domain/Concanavalin A-like lectin/glucanases superfamily